MESLNARLAAMKAEKDAKRDPAATALMERATADLRASGVMGGIAKAGDVAPSFARPNLDGESVRLRSLVKRGPVVVSFFRGRW